MATLHEEYGIDTSCRLVYVKAVPALLPSWNSLFSLFLLLRRRRKRRRGKKKKKKKKKKKEKKKKKKNPLFIPSFLPSSHPPLSSPTPFTHRTTFTKPDPTQTIASTNSFPLSLSPLPFPPPLLLLLLI